MVKTLEKQSGISTECGYCGRKLDVPKEAYQKIQNAQKQSALLDKKYDWGFVSPGGYFYCDHSCFRLYTED